MEAPEAAWGSSLEGSAVVEQVPGMIKNLNISTFGIWLVGMYIWARKCTCWNGQMSIENKNDGICEILVFDQFKPVKMDTDVRLKAVREALI